ncbi:MAG: hypothetical protein ACP5UH_00630 [Candidatus Micrarchaeia archaeon]
MAEAEHTVAKTRPQEAGAKSAKIRLDFTKIPGFNRAFILGGILGIILASIFLSLALISFIILVVLLALLAYAQNTIKFKGVKRYNLFVFSTAALFGFILGGILLYIMEKRARLFNWIVPFAIAVLLIAVLIGAAAYARNTVLFNTGVPETIPSEDYYYLAFVSYGNNILSGSYVASGPIWAYVLNQSAFDVAKASGFAGVLAIWQLPNSASGSFSVTVAPGNYTIVFINQNSYPITLHITRNITLSRQT